MYIITYIKKRKTAYDPERMRLRLDPNQQKKFNPMSLSADIHFFHQKDKYC